MKSKTASEQLILDALQLYGIKEFPGSKDNPVIMNMFKVLKHDWVENDETGWCSAFLNFLCKNRHIENSDSIKHATSLLARSWLNVGTEITLDEAELGDVIIFWRKSKSSRFGHVALFINKEGPFVNVLGGNQNNQVKISAYPISKILGVRRLDYKIL